MLPIHHQVYHHVRTHHKKYLFAGTAMAAFFAITKVMVFFATSFALFATSHDISFADQLPIDPLVQDTGSVLSGTQVPQDTGSTVITWDTTIDTGSLLYLLSLHAAAEFGSGSEGSGSLWTGSMGTGSSYSGDQLSGTLHSGEQLSGIVVPVVDTPTTGSSSSGYYESLFANQLRYCHTGDLIMTTMLSGQTFAGITPFQWTLSGDCISDNLSFQLYDHNNQWIEIAQLSGSNRGFSFDSHFLSTGWYATTGFNASGQSYTIPGLYSGLSTSFWTGYQVRILNDNHDILYSSSGFTIDNIPPTLTNLKFVYSGTTTNGSVHLLFGGSEILSGITISLSVGTLASDNHSGAMYDYILGWFGTGFSGMINYSITFADLWGNTSHLTWTK